MLFSQCQFMKNLRLLLLTITCCLFLAKNVCGQSDTAECGTDAPDLIWEDAFQKLIEQSKSNLRQEGFRKVQYRIPVIFHIIHGGEEIGIFPNIRSEQISAQITVLNQDFNAKSYNIADYPENAFVTWANNQNIPALNRDSKGRIKIANFNIEFCLAATDPSGNTLSEPGIDRINHNSKGWPNPNQFGTQATMKSYLDNILKPQSIWDVEKYLNVWITDKSSALTYAGVSSVPPLSGLKDIPNSATDSTDGVWCYAKAVGSNRLFPEGSYIGPAIDGRTLIHEVGHYLGLRHIWGDTACGNDFCNDTPPAAGQNSGIPNYPRNAGSCSTPSNNPDGEMFMNFMDYTAGPAKYMFTTDQMIRAHTALQNSPFRKKLGTHNLCPSLSAANEKELSVPPIIYPNPGEGNIRIDAGGRSIESVRIFNQFGSLLKICATEACSIADFSPGIYFVVLQSEGSRYCIRFSKI